MKGSAVLVALVLAILSCGQALAVVPCEPSPSPSPSPKTIVTLGTIQDVTIALPQAVDPVTGTTDATSYDFGPGLQSSLAAKMVSEHYILDQPMPSPTPRPTIPLLRTDVFDPSWDGTSVIPAATFKFTVDALVFRSGSRGDSMFYGFDERFRTPFNDGTMAQPEEFPLSVVQFQQWFDRTFQDRGTSPLDTASGLDLGEGFSLNALVAWVDVKYAVYKSEIRVRVEMDAPLVGRHEQKAIQVTGDGYYYDIVGGYEQWSGGIGLARTDAMTAAFNNASAGAYAAIDDWAKNLPLTAKLYSYSSPTQVYLNTGIGAGIPVGTRYVSVTNPDLVFEVTLDVPSSGSVAKLVSGDPSAIQTGMTLVEQSSAAQAIAAISSAQSAGTGVTDQPTPVPGESVSLPSTNLPKSDFAAHGWNPSENFWQAFLDSIVGTPLLPYRIWRYFEYDVNYWGPDWQNDWQNQNDGEARAQVQFSGLTPEEQSLEPQYQKLNQSEMKQKDDPSPDAPSGTQDWVAQMKQEPWAKQVGLDVAPAMSAQGPVIAVVDSGVDYNHPALNERIWTNPAPFTDPDGNEDLYGWDFISGDPRPFDDNYHGTEVASAIVGVAPLVEIMPLKVFNPFGITSSAAIYGAFQYAVDHGAKIIVAAWATQKQTQTIDMAVKYAHDHGVLVVVSAGDRGDDLSKNPSYPAVLSEKYDNVLTVTAVDTTDKLVAVQSFYANFDPASVGIAAPGENILVAQPRGHTSRDTTTSVAAGLVTGAIVRNWAASGGAGTYLDWIKQVRAQADVVPGLASAVQGGLRLHVK